MKPYSHYSPEERRAEYALLLQQFEARKAQGLSLNMARGKPGKEQLDLVSGILTALQSPEDCLDGSLDVRNYGELTGIPAQSAGLPSYWAQGPRKSWWAATPASA